MKIVRIALIVAIVIGGWNWASYGTTIDQNLPRIQCTKGNGCGRACGSKGPFCENTGQKYEEKDAECAVFMSKCGEQGYNNLCGWRCSWRLGSQCPSWSHVCR